MLLDMGASLPACKAAKHSGRFLHTARIIVANGTSGEPLMRVIQSLDALRVISIRYLWMFITER